MKSLGKSDINDVKIITLNSILNFGKFKGWKVKTLIDNGGKQRDYVDWLGSLSNYSLDAEALDYLSGIINANGYEDEETDNFFDEYSDIKDGKDKDDDCSDELGF